MLADPAEPGPLVPGLLHHGTRVHIGAAPRVRRFRLQERCERLQPLAEDLVVVLAPGVAGDAAVSWPVARLVLGIVVHSDRYDSPDAGKEQGGADPIRRSARDPVHHALIAPTQQFGHTSR